MSTDSGDAATVAGFVAQAKDLIAAGQAREAEQLDLLDQPTPEEMLDAREQLGPLASRRAVLEAARERKRGRPPGSKNKRTDDFARFLLTKGQHPAVTMMQIQSTPPEVLQQASRRRVTKVLKGGKDKPDKVVEIDEETLTYDAAQSLRVRCAEGLLPYLESKKPVAVDMTFSGVADLVIEGVTHSREEIIEGDYIPVDDADDIGCPRICVARWRAPGSTATIGPRSVIRRRCSIMTCLT